MFELPIGCISFALECDRMFPMLVLSYATHCTTEYVQLVFLLMNPKLILWNCLRQKVNHYSVIECHLKSQLDSCLNWGCLYWNWPLGASVVLISWIHVSVFIAQHNASNRLVSQSHPVSCKTRCISGSAVHWVKQVSSLFLLHVHPAHTHSKNQSCLHATALSLASLLPFPHPTFYAQITSLCNTNFFCCFSLVLFFVVDWFFLLFFFFCSLLYFTLTTQALQCWFVSCLCFVSVSIP